MAKHNFALKPLPTLSTITLPKTLFKLNDGRVGYEPAFQRFIASNKEALDFLGIEAKIITCNNQSELQLTTSSFVGVVPIRSSFNGVYDGMLAVTGRYGEQPQELMDLIADYISPEYNTNWAIDNTIPITPPIYVECCKYIDAYLLAEHKRWNKFTNNTISEKHPSGATNWTEYASRTSVNPLQATTFNNKRNILTTEHPQYWMLNFVCKLAIDILSQPTVPITTRALYNNRLNQASSILHNKGIKPTTEIKIHASDPNHIKHLKSLAAPILTKQSNARYAWRMDYAGFFERYVQYLFRETAKKIGGHIECNPHHTIHGDQKPTWGLAYLEPDMVVKTDTMKLVVDAKYKSHIYNFNDTTDELKSTFRHDLHQVLAYALLNNESGFTTQSALVYPASRFVCKQLDITAPHHTQIYLLGVPLQRSEVSNTIEKLKALISANVANIANI